ncbi:MAG TPA: hypothetical protein VKF62_12685, partial [Planctomycetota bacterium]|nr:hypothetical protein [Planctomycetota bacterium]
MVVIVPGRPGAGALTWWVLSDDGGMPALEVRAGTQVVAADLKSVPLPGPPGLGAFLVATGGLAPDRPYTLAALDGSGEAYSRTLPAAPLRPQDPFTIALASCYCVSEDKGLSGSYPPPRHHPDSPDPVRLRLLGGDQLYLDFSVKGDVLWKEEERPDPWA